MMWRLTMTSIITVASGMFASLAGVILTPRYPYHHGPSHWLVAAGGWAMAAGASSVLILALVWVWFVEEVR